MTMKWYDTIERLYKQQAKIHKALEAINNQYVHDAEPVCKRSSLLIENLNDKDNEIEAKILAISLPLLEVEAENLLSEAENLLSETENLLSEVIETNDLV